MRTRRILVAAVCALALIAMTATATAVPDRSARRMTGEVLDVDAEAMSLTVREEIGDEKGTRTMFLVLSDATIRIHGMKGKLADLKAGDIVTVTYRTAEGSHQASEIWHM